MTIIFFFISLIFLIYISFFINKSSFEGTDSDQFKQIKSIINFKDWFPWVSKVHFNNDKAAMKDMGIIVTFCFNFFLKKKDTINPIVFSSFFSHIVSGILIYFISNFYLSENTSLLISILYLISLWPFIIIFHAGYQVTAQMFFLICIIFLINSFSVNFVISLFFIFLSGVSFSLMNFTSASARKFIIPFLIIFLSNFYSFDGLHFISYKFNTLSVFKILNIIFLFIIFYYFYNNFNKKNFLTVIKNILLPLLCLFAIIYLNIFQTNEIENVYRFLSFSLGTLLVSFYFIYPNFKHSLEIYYRYLNAENVWGSHWKQYDTFYKKNINKNISKNHKFISLNIKLFWLMLPEILFLYFLSFVGFLISFYFGIVNINELYFFLICFILPITSTLWSEITGGPRASLPYYTIYICFFPPVAIFFEFILINSNYLYYLAFFILLIICKNFVIILFDIIPSRIHNFLIYKYLVKNNISEIYTYDNVYNVSFEKIINYENTNKIKFIYIKSISEIKSGYFFQPCLSEKTSYHQSTGEGIKEALYFDPVLKNIYEKNNIDKFTIKKFKTRGTSKYWHVIVNIIALRYLVFKDINKFDKILSYARILKF